MSKKESLSIRLYLIQNPFVSIQKFGQNRAQHDSANSGCETRAQLKYQKYPVWGSTRLLLANRSCKMKCRWSLQHNREHNCSDERFDEQDWFGIHWTRCSWSKKRYSSFSSFSSSSCEIYNFEGYRVWDNLSRIILFFQLLHFEFLFQYSYFSFFYCDI